MRKRMGVGLVCCVLLAALLGFALVGEERDRTLLYLGFAVLSGMFALAVAKASPRETFFWTGLGVFVAAGGFGAAITFERTSKTPKAKPVAVLVKGDLNGLSGLFVAETDDRLYLGRVALTREPRWEEAELKVADERGRLLWVPKSEVIAWSIGAARNVPAAMQAGPGLVRELQRERLGPAERRAAIPPALPTGAKPRVPRISIQVGKARSVARVRTRGLQLTVLSRTSGKAAIVLKRGERDVARATSRVLAGRPQRIHPQRAPRSTLPAQAWSIPARRLSLNRSSSARRARQRLSERRPRKRSAPAPAARSR